MPRIPDTWRLHRTKPNFNAEAFGGATHPGTLETIRSQPCRAIYVYLAPLTVASARVAYSASDTFSLAAIKISDTDVDDTVDATDNAIRTATLTDCTYWTEIKIPMGGALRWSVELSAMDVPATATQVQIWFREDNED